MAIYRYIYILFVYVFKGLTIRRVRVRRKKPTWPQTNWNNRLSRCLRPNERARGKATYPIWILFISWKFNCITYILRRTASDSFLRVKRKSGREYTVSILLICVWLFCTVSHIVSLLDTLRQCSFIFTIVIVCK